MLKYRCDICGNNKYFLENYTETVEVIFEQGNKIKKSLKPKLIEVICSVCNASTEYNSIVYDDSEEVVTLW